MSFEFFSVSFIAMLVGLVVCFSGHRFVPGLLAAWGVLFGYTLGDTAMHLLLGFGPRANLIGWGHWSAGGGRAGCAGLPFRTS